MKVVIVGGGIAGVTAAISLRKEQAQAQIVLIEKANEIGYIPSSLALLLKEEIGSLDTLCLENHKTLAQKYGITTYLNTTCLGLVDAHHLQLEGQPALFFDYLIIATGSKQESQTLALNDTPNVYSFKQKNEAKRFLTALPSLNKIAVIGAGQVGMEITQGLTKQKKQVSLFETQDYPLYRYIPETQKDFFIEALQEQSVTCHFNEAVLELLPTQRELRVLSSKGEYCFDAVVIATNTRTESTIWQDFLACNDDNTLKVNSYLQTSQPHIYAIGDAIQVSYPILKRQVYASLGSNALRSAKLVAKNLGENTTEDYGTTLVSVNRFFGVYLAQAGLLEKERLFYPREVKEVTYREEEGSSWTQTTLLYDTFFGDLIGAQLLSTNEVAKRINELAKKMRPTDAWPPENAFIPTNHSKLNQGESHES